MVFFCSATLAAIITEVEIPLISLRNVLKTITYINYLAIILFDSEINFLTRAKFFAVLNKGKKLYSHKMKRPDNTYLNIVTSNTGNITNV